MRKLVMMMSVSVDGFFDSPDGGLDWQQVDEELHTHFNEWLGEAGAFLDGRVTYELMADYWPTADADPSASQPEIDFARIWRGMPKFVFSTTLERADWNAVVVRDVIPAQIEEMKAQPGGDLVLGGADLGETFRRLGLIDEYRLYIHPVIIGRGKPLFRPIDAGAALRLAETRTFAGGVILLRYERV